MTFTWAHQSHSVCLYQPAFCELSPLPLTLSQSNDPAKCSLEDHLEIYTLWPWPCYSESKNAVKSKYFGHIATNELGMQEENISSEVSNTLHGSPIILLNVKPLDSTAPPLAERSSPMRHVSMGNSSLSHEETHLSCPVTALESVTELRTLPSTYSLSRISSAH